MKITDRAQKAAAEKESFERRPSRRNEGLLPNLGLPKLPGLGEGRRRGRRPVRRDEALFGPEIMPKKVDIGLFGEGRDRRPVRRPVRRGREDEGFLFPNATPEEIKLDIGGGIFGEGRDCRGRNCKPTRHTRPIRREEAYHGSVRRPNMANRRRIEAIDECDGGFPTKKYRR